MTEANLGCEFADLKEPPVIVRRLHSSKAGHIGPFPDGEEEKVVTVRRAVFLKKNKWKELLYIFFSAVSCGIFWLLLYWFPFWLAACRYDLACEDDGSAELVLLQALDEEVQIIEITKVQKQRLGNWKVQDTDAFAWVRQLSTSLNSRDSEKSHLLEPEFVQIIEWRHIRLWLNSETGNWHEIIFYPSQASFEHIHEVGHRLAQTSEDNSNARHYTYGKNAIKVEVESCLSLLAKELFSPYFVFQGYSYGVWIAVGYFTYSIVLLSMTITTCIYSALEVHETQKSLKIFANHEGNCLKASFCADKWKFSSIKTVDLVPGDIVLITKGMVCSCDFVLLSGQCIVSEAMLTGESAPVNKEPLPIEPVQFDVQSDRSLKHMLMNGSLIIQAKPSPQPPNIQPTQRSVWELCLEEIPVLAMVLQTGSNTAKGKLILTIQHPQDSRGIVHRQKEEAFKFLTFMLVLTAVACGWFTFISLRHSSSRSSLIMANLDLTTILIPATLPLVLAVGIIFAFDSLRKKKIFASSNNHIVLAGHVDCICYDKTGTLTTEGDTFVGLQTVVASCGETTFLPLTRSVSELPPDSVFRFVLAACHSLRCLGRNSAGVDQRSSVQLEKYCFDELIGEQLEIEMFKASGWEYLELPPQEQGLFRIVRGVEVPPFSNTAFLPKDENATFLVGLHTFPFDAERRMMSSIVLALNPVTKSSLGQYILVKGAPEVIKNRCVESSIPSDFPFSLEGLAKDGYRVLGCAYKELEEPFNQWIQQQPQAELEEDLIFCGFLIMGNQLKPESKDVLKEVKLAELRQCMVTGDNVYTAIALAKQCDNVFIDTDITYILDYDGDIEASVACTREVLLNEFILTYVSDGIRQRYFTTFQELLLSIELDEADFSLAISSNAFSSLLYMHHIDRAQFLRRNALARTLSKKFSRPRLDSNRSYASTISSRYECDGGEMFTPLELVLSMASVYARFKSQDKRLLMTTLQKVSGHYVCMVGDGANDMFALKSADIGLAISSNTQHKTVTLGDKQQSYGTLTIAAPFCTPVNNISPLKELLCEGRGALASTIIAFRYMMHCGVACTCQVIVLYMNKMLLSNSMWLLADFVNLPLAIFLNTTQCSSKLVKGVPETSIWGFRLLYSFGGHAIILILTQVLVLLYLRKQPWYIKYDAPADQAIEGTELSMEVTVIFWIQVSQYITSAIALSHDYAGFRGEWWTNTSLVVTIFSLAVFNILLMVCNKLQMVQRILNTVELPEVFTWEIVGFIVTSCLVHILFELSVPHKAKPHKSKLMKYQKSKRKARKILLESISQRPLISAQV